MRRRSVILVGSLLGGLLGLMVGYALGVRPLDIRFDASSVALIKIKTLKERTGDAPILQREFLAAVDHIELLHAGSASGDQVVGEALHAVEDRLVLMPGAASSCDTIRFEVALNGSRSAWGMSLYVDHSETPAQRCAVMVQGLSRGNGATDPVSLVRGDRIDFTFRGGAEGTAAPVRSLEILGSTPVGTISAGLIGEIRGLTDAHACQWGRHISISGMNLDVASLVVKIGPGGPVLDGWARSSLPTRFSIDGSNCLPALYAPQALWPLLLVAAFASAAWKILSWMLQTGEGPG